MFRVVKVSDRTAWAAQEGRDALADALEDIAEDCLGEANKTVPIEEGILSGSGFTEVDRAALEGQVAYDTPYAVVQHENPDFRHDPGRRAHWLERTVAENAKRWEAYLARLVGGRLR